MSDEISPFQWTPKKYLVRVVVYLVIWLFALSGCLFYLKFGNCPDYFSHFETLLGCILIGGIGGNVYCLRAIYLQACVKQEWDEKMKITTKRKSIPKWQKPLTAAERRHLKETMEGRVTLEGFKRNRAGQIREGIRCFECEIIASKLGLE